MINIILFRKDADGCFYWEHVVGWAIIAAPVAWMIWHF